MPPDVSTRDLAPELELPHEKTGRYRGLPRRPLWVARPLARGPWRCKGGASLQLLSRPVGLFRQLANGSLGTGDSHTVFADGKRAGARISVAVGNQPFLDRHIAAHLEAEPVSLVHLLNGHRTDRLRHRAGILAGSDLPDVPGPLVRCVAIVVHILDQRQ